MSFANVFVNYLDNRPTVTNARAIRNVSSNFYLFSRSYSYLKLYDNYDEITSERLNKLLSNQGISITQDDLNKIKKIPGVKFDLPLSDQTYRALVGLIGRPNTRGWKAGVYIFTLKFTGQKYVGSSNSLSRRLDQYFNFKHLNHNNSGQL